MAARMVLVSSDVILPSEYSKHYTYVPTYYLWKQLHLKKKKIYLFTVAHGPKG